jgi:lipopolysaccharide heptosyltransferase II
MTPHNQPATRQLLIVGPAWIGDMVMAQTLFKTIKMRQPHTAIDVVAPNWTRPLLERMPEIRRAMDLPFKHGEFNLKARLQLGKQLREQQYDQAIVLPNSWKSAIIPAAAKIPLRTGWRGEMRYGLLNDCRTLDKDRYPLMIERFAKLAAAHDEALPETLPHPKLLIDDASRQAALQAFSLSSDKPILALCPGAEFGPAKRWPTTYFAEVANHYLKQGFQVWLFGSPKEKSLADDIQQQTEQACVDLVGETSLAQAVDLLSLANKVVTNDSGLMHIAAALDRQLIVIYGSTSPQFTPPLTDKVDILQLPLDCSPCFKRECPLGHTKCLNELKPEQVVGV